MKLQAYLRSMACLLGALILSGCSCTLARVPAEQVKDYISSMGVKPSPRIVVVDTKKQTLSIVRDQTVEKVYTISTSKKGLGQKVNTFRTPQGLHVINEKIGEGVPEYGIFHRRNYIGSKWKPQPRNKHRKDYISTRIIRLEGLMPGFNRGKDRFGKLVDTEVRAVYIHGTTMEWKLGSPSTKGCVHMSAKDVIKLFNDIPVGTLVWIN